jgi:hypothetical protein
MKTFYIYEQGKAHSIMKILVTDKAEQERIANHVVKAVNQFKETK